MPGAPAIAVSAFLIRRLESLAALSLFLRLAMVSRRLVLVFHGAGRALNRQTTGKWSEASMLVSTLQEQGFQWFEHMMLSIRTRMKPWLYDHPGPLPLST